MLGRDSKTGAYKNSDSSSFRQGAPGVPQGGWWGPPQEELWGLVGAAGFALALSPKGSEQLGWRGHIWTLQGRGGGRKVPVGGLGEDIWAACGTHKAGDGKGETSCC